jgi:hypothetical protein
MGVVMSDTQERILELEARVFVLERFAKQMLDPEMFGHAVTGEVRDEARKLFGMPAVETKTNWNMSEGI